MDLTTVLKPLNATVVVSPVKREELSTSILQAAPSSSQERTEVGVVVALAEGTSTVELKIGSTVYFRRYSPDEIDVDGVVYLVLDVKDLVAIKL